ncbi:unnamed protein product [Brassicogethes aeneus]|uniref:Cytochrome P450 n=1 Tax=Brassicogethes aeneus TaxID=1431903 RepID=A0A9P0FLN9_BRAAE|nr:unnamed protein product [Brassicogethes aeneus]
MDLTAKIIKIVDFMGSTIFGTFHIRAKMFIYYSIAVLLVYMIIKRKFYLSKIKSIPCKKSLPLFGHTLILLAGPKSIGNLVKTFQQECKRICTVWFGPVPCIVVYNAEDMQTILRNSKEIPKGQSYNFLRPWLGESILISDGQKFRQNKKILVQTFHKTNLLDFLPIFNDNADNLIQNFAKHVGKGEFATDLYLATGAMFNLLGTTLGVHRDILTEEEAFNYSLSVEKMGEFVFTRNIKFWLRPDIFFYFSNLKKKQDDHLNILNNLTERVILSKKKEFDERKSSSITEFDENKKVLFLENFFSATKLNGEPFTLKEIKDEVMTMMFAGQDTTTVTLGFVLSLLGIHQDVQVSMHFIELLFNNKVYKELEEILGYSDRDINYEDTQKMVYLEQVIKETWRLYPPINSIMRVPIKDINLGQYVFPKGTTLLCSIFLLHRNEEYYHDSHRFNPERFNSDNDKNRPPYSFLPFSEGVRKCIGSKYAMLVVKVFLAKILSQYRVICNQKQRDFKLSLQLTVRRKEGFLISLEPRK